jgi:hypothetical protein
MRVALEELQPLLSQGPISILKEALNGLLHLLGSFVGCAGFSATEFLSLWHNSNSETTFYY